MKFSKKKLLSGFLAGVMTFGVLSSSAVFAASRLYGDVNGDGEVTNADITRLMRHLAGYDVEIDPVIADLNGDGVVTNADITRLMLHMVDPVKYPALDLPDDPDDPNDPDDPGDDEEEPAYDLAELDIKENFPASVKDVENTFARDDDSDAEELLMTALMMSLSQRDMDLINQLEAERGGVRILSDKTRLKYRLGDDGLFEKLKVRNLLTTDIDAVESLLYYKNGILYQSGTGIDSTYRDDNVTRMTYDMIASVLSIYAGIYPDFDDPDFEYPDFDDPDFEYPDYDDPDFEYPDFGFASDLLDNASVYTTPEGVKMIVIKLGADHEFTTELILEAIENYLDAEGRFEFDDKFKVDAADIYFEINAEGYLTSMRIQTSFSASYRQDASNVTLYKMKYDNMVWLPAPGEHVAIADPEGIGEYDPYDASEEIVEMFMLLFDEDGELIEGYEEIYGMICELYGKDLVDDLFGTLYPDIEIPEYTFPDFEF